MAANSYQVTFDFRDRPQLLDTLRLLAAKRKTTQKAILADALAAYFSNRQEELAPLMVAEKSFAEWENEEDQVYDTF